MICYSELLLCGLPDNPPGMGYTSKFKLGIGVGENTQLIESNLT